ncbi:MAG TPA: hypothetical protein VLC09_04090 [Polyangiaceae bacterium]|nr:hypothetical protein [Polyangiaceae bacterium]
MNLPFDEIIVRDGGNVGILAVGEFMALDLATRVRLVMSGCLQFRRGTETVPQGEALAALQKATAQRR